MADIRKLPIEMVNQIAAGEVVERPASVVKELVENALDAGAGRVDVTVADGGKKLVAVTDDGAGMSAEDLALAFCPHATSKISRPDDLFNIATLGFRGEALASVASISHAHIRTRRPADTSGYEITSSDQTIGEPRPCAAAAGTTVTIRDLFFNTPARRKFMRTANTEFSHVSERIARLALPYPQVAFGLTHNGRSSLDLPAVESTATRVADLFGAELAETLLPLARRNGSVQVKGLIGPPAAARGSSKWQYFFLNGRFVRDRLLAHALREAYRGLIDPNRWPVAFIFLTVDPADVDVNVHPTKIEVRFRDGQLVHGELLAALRDTLNKSNLTPSASLNGREPPAGADSDAVQARRESLKEALADFFKTAAPAQRPLEFPARKRDAANASAPAGASTHVAAAPQRTETATSEAPVPASIAPTPPIPVSAIQVHDSYIVAAEPDGVIIVDQHALHERLIYNELTDKLTAGPLAGQRLLIPETISVTDAEVETISRSESLLARLGVEVAPFGPRTIAIRRFPSLLIDRGVSAGEFLRELLDQLTEAPAEPEPLIERVLCVMACKAAVKAGDKLTDAEIADLLARRGTAGKGSACPHGRPTTLKLTLKELEKQFKRS